MTTIILAIVIGAAFGAVLDRIGASNPTWIGRMLSLTNLHLMKTIPGIMSVIQGNQMPIGYFADRCKRRCEIKQRPHTSTYRDEK